MPAGAWGGMARWAKGGGAVVQLWRMPVNSTHPDYDATLPAWLRARDVVAGEDAVKAAGEKYLPCLDSQSDDEYAAYRARASFFNATARSAEAYIGLIFRRPPFVKLPESSSALGKALAGRGYTVRVRHRDVRLS